MRLARAAALAFLLAAVSLQYAATAQDRQSRAEEIFDDTCIHCHDTGGWGTRKLALRAPPGEAELLRRKNLPAAYTAQVVRRGIGAMPPLTPTDLTDEELERLARWLDGKN